jgi:flagellar biosynthesis protein FlhF
MRLKLFHAPNMTAAMALVRDSLGPDALILSTRRVADGVEVTAALEPALNEAPPLPTPPPPVDPARNAALAWHGVPQSLMEALAPGRLADALPDALRFGDLPLDGAAPLLVAGPPGAGKTLTIAKLATRLVMAGRTPLVVTADGQRAGAPEQLAAYTRLLGLTLVVASTPAPLSRALARSQDSPVLIDTPGLDPFDASAREELLALAAAAAAAAGAVTALALPAGLDPAEAQELAEAFAEAGATLLIPTRLDLSRRLGGVLAAASAGLTITEAGVGSGAADGLRPLTPELLASRLTIPPGVHAPAPQDIAS